jgi:hypothetical protein
LRRKDSATQQISFIEKFSRISNLKPLDDKTKLALASLNKSTIPVGRLLRTEERNYL